MARLELNCQRRTHPNTINKVYTVIFNIVARLDLCDLYASICDAFRALGTIDINGRLVSTASSLHAPAFSTTLQLALPEKVVTTIYMW